MLINQGVRGHNNRAHPTWLALLLVLLNTGCMSYGPTIRIETPEPAEDFVVVCGWYGGGGIIAGSGSRKSYKVFIARSGEVVECGLGFTASSQVQILHPLYTKWLDVDEDGISVIRPKSRLQILDEQKAKFEAGYWDKFPNPGAEYARSLVGCGFPLGYLDYYSEVKKVDKEHFKRLYYKPISDCFNIIIPILKEHRKTEYGNFPDADHYINKLWNPATWRKYNE